MSDLIGKTISNRYRVASLLGRGGMGDVYKVWDSQRGVFLAMKVLHADLAEDKVFLRRFAREAETLSALQHPHIVRFYGLEQEGRLTFMLMDYVEGTTLRGQIFDSSKPFTTEQVLQVIKPVCSALHYAHQMGCVHCDIKPANIMVKSNGDVLVADFGIARMMENSTTTTMAGAGTPAYMAPEQILGKKMAPQTDIYALGIVLYEMFTGGERPFTGEQAQVDGSTAEKVRWEQITLQPPLLRKYNSDISPQLEAVVSKCLQKKVEDRYADAFSLLNALGMEVKEYLLKPVGVKGQKSIVSRPVEKEKIVELDAKINQHKKQTSPLVWLLSGFAIIVLGLVFSGILSSSASLVPTLTLTSLPLTNTFTPDATNTPAASPTSTLGIGATMIGEDGAISKISYPIFSSPVNQELENIPNIWDLVEYNNPTSPVTLTYNTFVLENSKYKWGAIWCGKNAKILQEILKPLTMTLLANDQVVEKNKVLESDETSSDWSCHIWRTIISGWQPNMTTKLELSYFLSETIYDGQSYTQKGKYNLIIFVVTQ